MWNLDDILSVIVTTLRREHARLTAEQAVHNIDALDEVALHPIIASGLHGEGWGVLREQPYPGEWLAKTGRRRRLLPDQSQRMRCDLVLTPAAGQTLIDPLVSRRDVLEDLKQAERTLFMSAAQARVASAPPMPAAHGVPPDEACWLEFKVVGQFCPVAGVPGPNTQYGTALVGAAAGDLRKLAGDAEIVHGALALVLFTQTEAVAQHDLRIVTERCINRGVLSALPRVMGFDVLDRIGNTRCTVAVFEPVSRINRDAP